MIELVVYPKARNPRLINNSPFCAKAEIFMRLAKIDYNVNEFNSDPKKFPKGKLPVIKHNGKTIPDSYFVQKYLENEFKIDLDKDLSLSERAQGFAFAKMCEEFLYWSVLHERWFIDSNWVKLRDMYFSNIPGLIRGFVTNLIRKDALKAAKGHGMSLHSDEEVIALGKESLRALADFLGPKQFLLGDRLSSYDSTIYAFVASTLHSELGPELKKEAQRHSNLTAYDERMFALCFGK